MSQGGSSSAANFPYANKARDLVLELKHSDWLPPYNDESVRQIIAEINALYHQIVDTLPEDGESVEDPSVACPLVVYHHSIMRSKRCLLAYLQFRLAKLQELRWHTGSVIPQELRENLSSREITLFSQYDKMLGEYMRDIDLDLTADLQPPKHLYIEVRALEECGEILTENGPVVLDKNSTHYLRRSDVEHLIRQNLLQQID